MLHGRYKEVAARTRGALKRLTGAASWSDAIEGSGLVDVESTPGLLVMHGPNPLLAQSTDFQLFAPHRLARDAVPERLPREALPSIFEDSLRTSWGALCLMSQGNSTWLARPERHGPFLSAVLRYWDEWDTLGERFSWGSTHGQRLWEIPTTLKFVLANRGVETARLQAPLTTEEIRQTVERALPN
jgi:hypothetical protein